jgi:hypothetical protein
MILEAIIKITISQSRESRSGPSRLKLFWQRMVCIFNLKKNDILAYCNAYLDVKQSFE